MARVGWLLAFQETKSRSCEFLLSMSKKVLLTSLFQEGLANISKPGNKAHAWGLVKE